MKWRIWRTIGEIAIVQNDGEAAKTIARFDTSKLTIDDTKKLTAAITDLIVNHNQV